MKKLLLSLFVASISSYVAQAQIKTKAPTPPPPPTSYIQNYFTEENKVKEVAELQKDILKGCTIPLKQKPALNEDEMAHYVEQTKFLLEDKFSKSFAENPAIKPMLFKALDDIQADPSCYKEGNNCRERLVATAVFYFQNLRPNMPGCNGYVKYDYTTPSAKKKRAEENGYIKECEAELQLRGERLSGYGRSNGGMNQVGAYTDTLTNELNDVAISLATLVLHKNVGVKYEKVKVVENGKKVKVEKISMLEKHRYQVDICGDVQSGVGYQFPLRMNVYSEAFAGYDPATKTPSTTPEKVPDKKPDPKPCVEEVTVQHSEFVPVNFDEGSAELPQKKTDVNKKEVDPVRQKIAAFIESHPDVVITNIDVTSSSSKTPFYKPVGSKRVFDRTYSDDKNLKLAQSRADVAQRILTAMRQDYPGLSEAQYSATGAINGPDFDEADLSLRGLKPGSKGYKEKVEAFYTQYKDVLEKDAMIKSSQELLDKNRFGNLYEAKYKPYQGFKVVISGFSKSTRKCGDKDKETEKKEKEKSKTVTPTTSGKSQN